MKAFDIEYHHQQIRVETGDGYRLRYSDGRWLHMVKQEDSTGTVSIFNESTRYATASSWIIESKSEGPDWVNKEQLQVLGELIALKEQEHVNANKSAA